MGIIPLRQGPDALGSERHKDSANERPLISADIAQSDISTMIRLHD